MSAYVGLSNNPFSLLGEEDIDEVTDTSIKKADKKGPSKAAPRKKAVERQAESHKPAPQNAQSAPLTSSRKKPAKPNSSSGEPQEPESVSTMPEQSFKTGRDQGRPLPNGSRRRGVPPEGYPKGNVSGNRRSSTNRRDSIKKDIVGKGSWGSPVEVQKGQKQAPAEEPCEQEEPESAQPQEQVPEKKAAPLMTLEQYMCEMKSNTQGEDSAPAKSRGIYVSSEENTGTVICVPSKSKNEAPKPKDNTKKKTSGAKSRSQKNVLIFNDKISVTSSAEHHKTSSPGGPNRRYRNDDPRVRDPNQRGPRRRRPPSESAGAPRRRGPETTDGSAHPRA